MVAQWIALSYHSKNSLFDSQQRLSVWSLHVLLVLAWVFSRYFGFLHHQTCTYVDKVLLTVPLSTALLNSWSWCWPTAPRIRMGQMQRMNLTMCNCMCEQTRLIFFYWIWFNWLSCSSCLNKAIIKNLRSAKSKSQRGQSQIWNYKTGRVLILIMHSEILVCLQ